MDSKVEQAREWSELANHHWTEKARAAAEVIQSLPDEWIDAEKVQAMIDNYKHARDSNAEGTEGWVINHLMVSNLESLLPAPPLPTLAELIEQGNDPQQYQWMQADLHGGGRGVIAFITADGLAAIWFENPNQQHFEISEVTPLPDLPRLEWPAQEPRNPETPPAEMVNSASSDAPRNSEEIVKVIRYEKELCLSSQDFSRAMLWGNMERAAGRGEWKDLLNSIRELKLPKGSDSTLVSRLAPEHKENA